MQQELSDLSNTLLEIYQNNLLFLKENFFDIFQKVDKLSIEIENGSHKENYSLEYRDGYFDIFNHNSSSYFYNSNSYEDADARADFINFTKDGSLDLLRKNPYNPEKKLISGEVFADVAPIIDYVNEAVDFENIEFDRIYKFIYIGTGLGVHLTEIHKKVNALSTMIIEPDLEIFRLSLFVTDYTVFDKSDKKLFLSVGDEMNNILATLDKFYRHHNYLNYNIKHHLFLENYSHILDEIISYFNSHSPTHFPYKYVVDNVDKIINFGKNKERFFNFDLILEKNILRDKKVLIISAGPSVDNYIDWIYENQDKFLIICVDVILKKLYKNKIKPSIVVSIDPLDLCADFLDIDDYEFLKDTSFVFMSQQAEKNG